MSKVPGSVTRGPTYSVGSMAAEAARVVASVSGAWEEKAWRLMRVNVSSLTLVTVPPISTLPLRGTTGLMVSMWTTSGSSVGAAAGATRQLRDRGHGGSQDDPPAQEEGQEPRQGSTERGRARHRPTLVAGPSQPGT